MKKTLSVLGNEVMSLISRPSFWLAALGLPLIAALIFAVIGWINQGSSAAQALSQAVAGPAASLQSEGYVDHGGLMAVIPESVPPGTLRSYSDEASARAALQSGEIAAYYIIPADYIESGKITVVRPDFNPLAVGGDQSALFEWVLNVNLLNGDEMKASLLNGPLNVEAVSLATTPIPDETNPMTTWAPYAMTLMFYMLIISSASLLLGSISKEKENRVIEILLTSVTPTKLLTGKIIGLGLVGLGQTLLWLGTSVLLLNRSGTTFNLNIVFQLPPAFLAWGLVFFILGFAVYASLMAGLGALAPNLREASQATFVIMLPLMIPMIMGNTVFARWPNGSLATFLSIFPLSAPPAMMARLAVGGVAWWQPWLAAVLLAVTVVFIVRSVANMFRAQALLSGQGFNVKGYLRALVGK